MDSKFIFNLKQPCKNRGVTFHDNRDGTVCLDGQHFETMKECEDYLETMDRVY